MAHLAKILIRKDATDRLKKLAGQTIEFLPGLNMLVGENGIGKSGILYNLTKPKDSKHSIKLTTTGAISFFHFDTEKMNPRVSTPSGTSFEFGVVSRFMSHGECLIKVLEHFKELTASKQKSYLVAVDEPEGGLSPWKQKELLDMYIKQSKRIQIIIATHSLVFTKSKVGRLIELSPNGVQYFDPPCSYDWRGI